MANEVQQWDLEFPPMAASSQPIELTVNSSHGFERVVRDILVGDVWYVTGTHADLRIGFFESESRRDATRADAIGSRIPPKDCSE